MASKEVIKGMEELFFAAVFSGQVLNIIDQKSIETGSVTTMKMVRGFVSNGIDKLIHELLGRKIANPGLGIVLQHLNADGVE